MMTHDSSSGWIRVVGRPWPRGGFRTKSEAIPLPFISLSPTVLCRSHAAVYFRPFQASLKAGAPLSGVVRAISHQTSWIPIASVKNHPLSPKSPLHLYSGSEPRAPSSKSKGCVEGKIFKKILPKKMPIHPLRSPFWSDFFGGPGMISIWGNGLNKASRPLVGEFLCDGVLKWSWNDCVEWAQTPSLRGPFRVGPWVQWRKRVCGAQLFTCFFKQVFLDSRGLWSSYL